MRYVESLMRPFSVNPRFAKGVERGSTRLHTLEFALEEIAGTRPVTERVRHFKDLGMRASAQSKPVRWRGAHQRIWRMDGRSESGEVDDCDFSASSGWLRQIPLTIQFYPRSLHPLGDTTLRSCRQSSSRKMPRLGDHAPCRL